MARSKQPDKPEFTDLLVREQEEANRVFEELLESERQKKAHSANNATQSQHKGDTNTAQTQHKVSTKSAQEIEPKTVNAAQTQHKLSTKLSTELSTKSAQKRTFEQLVGIQATLVEFVKDECVKSGKRGVSRDEKVEGRATNYLTPIYVANACNISQGSIFTTIRRLEEMGLVYRGKGGITGRCARSIYVMLDEVFSDVQDVLKSAQTQHKLSTKLSTELSTTPSSSSSLQAQPKKTTTTTKPELPDEWKQIDCSPLREQEEAFGEGHIYRLFKMGKNTPYQVQENIKRIAFAVKHKTQKFTKSPIAMLMGLGKEEGKTAEFDPPKGYFGIPLESSKRSGQALGSTFNDLESTLESQKAMMEAKRQIAALATMKDMPQ